MLKDLGKRAGVSAIAVFASAILLKSAYHPWMRFAVVIFVGALSAAAAWEFRRLSAEKGIAVHRLSIWGCAAVTASFFVGYELLYLYFLPAAVFAAAMLLLFVVHFRATEGAIADLATGCFALAYIGIPLGMILGIIYVPMAQDGRIWAAYLIVLTKAADIGAYFMGSLLGRHKLASKISPAKTIEGAVAGFALTLGASVAFYMLGSQFPNLRFYLTLREALVLGALIGVAGQIGDLAESLLKRDANKKDSNLLPGLGGVLDAVDSLLFTAPIIYLYLAS